MQSDFTTIPAAALPFPVMLIDATHLVTAISPVLTEILGHHLVGRHYITALRQPILLEAIEAVMQGGKATTARWLGRNGAKDSTWLVHIMPAEGGRVVLTFEDRTAAEAVGQLRRDFVANVSHELRTPLTALQGFIETLRGAARNDAEARERFLAIMERETARMTQLVDDLLSLSRVEENERMRPAETVGFGALVAATLSEMEPVIASSGVAVTFRDDSGGGTVLADANQLRQVVGNLIQNAVKYGGSGGVLNVTLDAPDFHRGLRGQGVALHVEDHGPGIATHHIPRLTERFYRVDAHRSRSLGGTGLGLAIVKHIVNRHRGRLMIESELGQGTTCSVILPTA